MIPAMPGSYLMIAAMAGAILPRSLLIKVKTFKENQVPSISLIPGLPVADGLVAYTDRGNIFVEEYGYW
jgi:hypothetical protein